MGIGGFRTLPDAHIPPGLPQADLLNWWCGYVQRDINGKKKKKRGYLQWYCSERSLSSPLAVPCQWCLLLLLSNAPLNKPSSMGSTGVTCTWVLFLCNSMPWMGCPMRSQVASAQFLVSAEFGGSIKKKWHHNHNAKKGVNEKIQQWYSSRRFYKNTKFLTESQWGTLCLYSMFGQLCGTQVLSS